MALSKLLLASLWVVSPLTGFSQNGTLPASRTIEGIAGVADAHATAAFRDLAQNQISTGTRQKSRPRPKRRSAATNSAPTPNAPVLLFSPQGANPQSPSPAPSVSFVALPDNDTTVPPDTMGAVGPNHLMTALNSQVRIQDKFGGVISTVGLNAFWSPVGGAPDVFDPKVAYDPFNNRWMFSAAANGSSASSEILIAVSQTSDPTGTWYMYKVVADNSGVFWADYPCLGFNKDWIVVSVNMFPVGTGNNSYVNIYAFNKTNLYANGTGLYTRLQDNSGNGFTLSPATTYDNTLAVEYLLEDWTGASAELRLSRITGAVGQESLELGFVFPVGPSTWGSGGNGDFLPQSGSSHKIDAGDSRVLNCIYRNGALWMAQTAFLPEALPSHTAAQWWEVSTTGTVLQFGRLEDATGVTNYAYPCIAPNRNGDAMMGYSRFSASQYASANYAFRYAGDAAGTMRDDILLKAGEGCYYKTFGGPDNRWGDYSSTMVDPVNDLTLWTIQEYAATGSSCAVDGGLWGTWWGRVDAAATVVLSSAALVSESCGTGNGVIDPGETVSVSFGLQNIGSAPVSNLVAQLQATGGVTLPSAPATYGVLLPSGPAVTHTFSFTAGGSCGGVLVATFALQDGTNSLNPVSTNFVLGSSVMPLNENFDSVTAPALPAGWTATLAAGSGTPWRTSAGQSHSSPNSVFSPDPGSVTDDRLTTPAFVVASSPTQLSFWQKYDLEDGYDGGVLEISINGGAFTDMVTAGGSFVTGGYNGTISSAFGNPLGGRSGWTGNSGTAFSNVVVNLPPAAAGQSIQLRWRMGSDSSTSATGWYVDDVQVNSGFTCCHSLVAPTILNPHTVGTSLVFSFDTITGQTYFVESDTNLPATHWQPLQTNTGNAASQFFTNSTVSSPKRFYRLRSQ